MSEHVWWYVARASGIVAWTVVVAAVLWGLAFAGRFSRRRPPPAWTLDLHRFLGGLAVTFTAVHLSALVADSYSHFGWSELFVPLASRWRPGAVAWGIVAFYLLVAVELTSLLMRFLPRELWRLVHLSSFLLATLATVHGLTAGTDAGQPLVRTTVLVAVGVVAAVVATRVALPITRARRRRTAGRRPQAPSTV